MATKNSLPKFTVPSLDATTGAEVAAILQQRLHALNDLALTLKHVHWNVVGPHFMSVHEMIDPQVDVVREYVDEIAERIATLGVSVKGTPGSIVADRSWDDYSIGRADAIAHLGALDVVYQGVIADHRKAADDTEETDPVTNDMLIGHLHQIELFHWFIRAHLENAGGALATAGDVHETEGAADGAKAAAKGAA
ncbi:DNA starvation/stationary phase protection protein [Nakamurella sp. YIM 132087]|uniref:DNA starvation/stationary phase protection protein n=1 Tax=Nakamurella alba TaxID=2665158 RepID=A0A7K1FSN4_9ACTN|nr:DNA starvation/stationary phase protection protein [Nakamurella alba]MTD15854.1 DNA starvation/stationary phase protection protein [Nakamurella alba]